MDVEIRRVEPQDAAEFKAVRLAALLDAPSAFGSSHEREAVLTDDEWSGRARLGSTGDDFATFLAWLDGRAVGIVAAYRATGAPTTVELVSMWTEPSARRRGVARRLVDAVLEWTSHAPTTNISLWVTVGNTAAQTLYESMGFHTTDEFEPLPSDPNETIVRMRLRTAPRLPS